VFEEEHYRKQNVQRLHIPKLAIMVIALEDLSRELNRQAIG
jgi:hypothetical protein